MDLRAKIFNIHTGTPLVAVIHKTDAIHHDLHATDRVELCYKKKKVLAVVDILDHFHDPHRADIMAHGCIGLFSETAEELGVPDGELVSLHPEKKPDSLKLIKRKIEGKELREIEVKRIVKDIVDGAITDIELTSFVVATAIRGMTFEEMTYLTKAVATTGDRFSTKRRPVIDKHCIGGVPGNRTTMVVVPILASFGLTMPKTSSRAITSPAGTADTMEVLANVSLPLSKMKRVVETTSACMVWGGAMNLAPADDKIIRIERPLGIDVTGLMLSSVLAKKYSVGATHVIIDIPYGKGAKVEHRADAERLKEHFLTLGKLLGMKIVVVMTDGRQPIGNGIGPVLEAIDVMKVLKNAPDAPRDLREKSLMVAGELLEFVGSVQKGLGFQVAREVLDSGDAHRKMQEIIAAQGGHDIPPLSTFTQVFTAKKSGVIVEVNNKSITKVCRLAGAPITKTAGVYLHKKCGAKVKKGEPLFTAYAGSEHKLQELAAYVKKENPYVID